MIKNFSSFLLLVLISTASHAEPIPAPEKVQADVQQILKKVLGDSASISYQWSEGSSNTISLSCQKDQYVFNIKSSKSEATSTLYYGLRKLGFLFPHPRIEINPTAMALKSHCKQSFTWKPRLEKRGFHFHTMHPSEWVAAYFMGHNEIAEQTHRWLVRNQQNIFEVQMLQLTPDEEFHVIANVQEAKTWGLEVGLSGSFAMIQQRSYNMIPFLRVLFHWDEETALSTRLNHFLDRFPVDFVTFELGSSEFTATKPERTIAWMNTAAQVLKSRQKGMFIKVHASNNQHDEKHGNFNFLPQFADPHVGILPHSVFFYGLVDPIAPMYHRKDYKDMQEFYLKESKVRPNMYYPETSYWIFMDVDAPLLLTDYLKIRTDDVDWMQDHGLKGHLNFSTGQELGYWLMDYQVTLLADSESRKDPLMAIKLLGENPAVWQKILDWQNLYFKQKQLIQTLFFSNLLDGTPFAQPVHEHLLIRDLKNKKFQVQSQVDGLLEALEKQPSFTAVKNPELRQLLEVTALRLRHALALRQAALSLDEDKIEFDRLLNEAQKFRTQAFEIMDHVFKDYTRYTEIPLDSNWDNPTSYSFGYIMTARDLSQWEREELILKEKRINPLFRNLVNPLRILIPRKIFNLFDWF